MEYDDEMSEQGEEGPVVVTRSVYDAGMELEDKVKGGTPGPAFEIAREKAEECRTAGDQPGAARWTGIFNFLMERESVADDVTIVILEEGEEWDGKKVVRKSGSDPRRMGREHQ